MSCKFDCKNAFIRKSPKDLIVTSLIQKMRESIYSEDDVIREKMLEMVPSPVPITISKVSSNIIKDIARNNTNCMKEQ